MIETVADLRRALEAYSDDAEIIDLFFSALKERFGQIVEEKRPPAVFILSKDFDPDFLSRMRKQKLVTVCPIRSRTMTNSISRTMARNFIHLTAP